MNSFLPKLFLLNRNTSVCANEYNFSTDNLRYYIVQQAFHLSGFQVLFCNITKHASPKIVMILRIRRVPKCHCIELLIPSFFSFRGMYTRNEQSIFFTTARYIGSVLTVWLLTCFWKCSVFSAERKRTPSRSIWSSNVNFWDWRHSEYVSRNVQ